LIPWIIGFVCFTGGPILATFGLSFTNYTGVNAPSFIGVSNYSSLFSDSLFLKSLTVTIYYTLLSLPLSLVFSLLLALLLHQRVIAQGVFRTIFYLPTVISGVAVALLWQWLLNPDFGLVNYVLSFVHINGISWFLDERTVIPAFAFMSLWSCGGSMVVFMAALQAIPTEQYEVAALDGADSWHKFWSITLPLISPSILFNLITGIIILLQVFVPAYIITQGGPNFASEFYVLYLFSNAFQNFKFGYASAQAFILFVLILVLTVVMLRISSRFVYYESE
jgi:multiple sugar transport system permease protein